jgi:NADH-quinone oxidoreductase subunit K
MITLGHYLGASGLLFLVGLAGVILRRELLVLYMCLEMMLNAANLAFVALSRFRQDALGQAAVFFIITIAAAEVAVGLSLIVALYRIRRSTKTEDLTLLRF